MTEPHPAELRRWSEEVARDPGAPAFLPLASAYRRQGRRDAALRVCLRGLERHPTHVEAHALLARLYLEGGDRQRAADEWSMVLRLDPHNFESLRGLGFVSLERGDLAAAERHLTRALEQRADDRTLRAAMEVLRQRQAERAAKTRTAAPPPSAPATPAAPPDPIRLFDSLAAEAPFLGALVLDAQGLIVGGQLVGEHGPRGEALGAGIGTVAAESVRVGMHLGLGSWRGLLLETPDAMLHVSAVDDGHLLVVAAKPGAPAGWVLKTAKRAQEIAAGFVEGVAV